MTAKTPEPEASSSSSVPDPSKPTAKPVTNADPTTSAPASAAPASGSTSAAGPTSTGTPAAPAAAAPATAAPADSAPAASTATGPPSTAIGATAATKALPAGKSQAGPPARVTPPARKAPLPGPRRGGGGGAAAVVAVASLLVAIGAIAIAVYALDVAREAKSEAAIAASDARPVGPAAAPTPAPTPTAAPTTPPPPPPTYTAELSGAVLRIPPAESLCASVYVDVDTLQTGNYAGHEFYVSRCQGQHVIRIDRKEAAVPTSPSPTPEMCAAQLDGAASAPEIILDVRAGLTFCLLTSRADAAQQGIAQHLAIVEVRAVGADQSLATVISTYRVPA